MRSEGRHWPLILAGLLLGGVGANIALMLVATGDASFAVEPNYYAKAVAWDETMAQEAKNAALGWGVAVTLDRAPVPGKVELAARITDRAGAPISGASVSVEAFHSSRARRVFTAPLLPAADGRYAVTLPLERPGLWEIRVRIERGPEVFTRTVMQDLPAGP